MEESRRLGIQFLNQTSISIDELEVKKHLESILQRQNHPDRLIIELVLVGDKLITTLNHKYLGHNQPTDILSFPQSPFNQGSNESEPFGSLVISLDTAQVQADKAEIDLLEEVKMLAGHGLLHILGFNHQ